jgi:hypothetical protein
MKFTLNYPLQVGMFGRAELVDLTLRRLNGRDLADITKEKRSPKGDHLRLLVQRITSLSKEQIDSMDASDFLRLGEIGAAMMEGTPLPHIVTA